MMNNTQKLLIGALVIGAVSFSFLGGCGLGASTWGAGMMGGWGGMMSGWGGMGLGMGFFVVLFIVGVFLLFSDRFSLRGGYDNAKDIARERFARGEISQDEFEELMKRL